MTKKQATAKLDSARANLSKYDPDTTEPTPAHLAARRLVAVAWADYCKAVSAG